MANPFQRSGRKPRDAAIKNLSDHTSTDPRTGAVRSVQAADVLMTEPALREVWSAEHLERLARTYWRFLARITLGVVHVHYHGQGRAVVLLVPAIKLITFAEPEYAMAADRGLVRWRIEGGLLVAGPRRRGSAASDQGHLQIEVRRRQLPLDGSAQEIGLATAAGASITPACVHIEVEVASFYPAIAFSLSRRLYDITQSRIHVLITHAFLRSLVRRSSPHGIPHLEGSKIRRFAAAHDRRAGRRDSEPPAAQAS